MEQLGAERTPAKRAICVAAGGDSQSGHSAVLTADGSVYTLGCDRWQQLGLGSSSGGTAGYTWLDGKIWQREPHRVTALDTILEGRPCRVVDIAAGSEHTACLCSTGEVVTFGRGHKGQLGLATASKQRGGRETGPWLSCPAVSPVLSSSSSPSSDGGSTNRNSNGRTTIRIGAQEDCTCTFRATRIRPTSMKSGEGSGTATGSGPGSSQQTTAVDPPSSEWVVDPTPVSCSGRCDKAGLMERMLERLQTRGGCAGRA